MIGKLAVQAQAQYMQSLPGAARVIVTVTAPKTRAGRGAQLQPCRAMLLEHLPRLAYKRIILASASPRRSELLAKQLGLQFEVMVSSFEETLPKERFSGAQYAEATAAAKAADVISAMRQPSGTVPADLVIAADTVVELEDVVLEKPADADDAARMLRSLSGTQHRVHTGVALGLPTRTGELLLHSFSVTTTVWFEDLTEAAIQAYIDTGEPFGKAGAYGIQGLASSFVRRVDGCYFNIVGLPVHRLGLEMAVLIEQGEL